jgi:hypothetical protein
MGSAAFLPFEEIVLQIFIAVRNTSLSVGFESANLAYSGKHDKHYTTEND